MQNTADKKEKHFSSVQKVLIEAQAMAIFLQLVEGELCEIENWRKKNQGFWRGKPHKIQCVCRYVPLMCCKADKSYHFKM